MTSDESLDLSQVDLTQVPRHIGLILDGNGRWANQRGLPRTAGHLAGEEALFDTIEGGLALGVEWMTAYTFSTENWERSDEEVEFLMWFNEDLLTRRRDELNEKGVRMAFAGDFSDPRIPERNRRHMAEAATLTEENTEMTVVFAFNYGSRSELIHAARALVADAIEGEIAPDEVDEEAIRERLWVPDMPDVDLVIRSSGEHRLSNFLLWQSAYAEFSFPGILWPDFDRHALVDAVVDYQNRDRRFGGAIDQPEG